jgi:predicted ester cyclase
MLEEENKAIFRHYVEEVSNEGNLDLVDEIFDRYISHQSDGRTEERGPEDVKRFIGEFRQAFPDFRSTIEYQVAEGDMVVTRWRASGTHQGEFRGIAPTGKPVAITGIGIFRFSDEGKVMESWDNLDELGMMQQMDAIPQSGSALHEGRITPEEISGRTHAEPPPQGGISPEEISGG